MPQHYNGLSAAEDERLALLLDELAEAQQVIAKIMRHGYTRGHPASHTTNREDLQLELGHIAFAVALMVDSGDLSSVTIMESRITKGHTVWEWLHHQQKREIKT